MASDTSLVFNLVARDQASGELQAMQERFATASAAIGIGVASALGVGVAANLDMEAASDKMAAQLGVGPAEAAELSQVSARLYTQAWGDSTATVNAAVRGVYQNIGDTSAAEGGLEGVTAKALAVAETFDQDVNAATAAAGQLMKTGLAADADEAFDIITAGFQNGADKSGDFLDTLNEYGVQFEKFGLDGQTATGLISQGLQAGARDADVVADAVKEFSILSINGSESTKAGFDAIGLSAGEMAAQIGRGGDDATAALDLTLDKLRGIEDPVARNAAAVNLFGTQAEDLGDALFALDPSSAVSALGEVGGAADRMAQTLHDNPKMALEAFKRSAIAELGEIAGTFIQFAGENKGTMTALAVVLGVVAAAIVTVSVAQKVYATYTAIATAANTVLASSSWKVIAGWTRMTAVGLASYARIAAAAVASAARTSAAWAASAARATATWLATIIRIAITTAAQFVMMAARAIAWAAIMAAQWLIAMGPIGWITIAVIALVALIIAKWETIRAWTAAIWTWVWTKIKQVADFLVNLFLNFTLVGLIIKHWNSIKNATTAAWNAVVNFVKTIPGKLLGFFLNWTLPGLMIKHWSRIKDGSIEKAKELVAWVKGLPGMITSSLGNLGNTLWNAGVDLIAGFIRGIQSMFGGVQDTLGSLTSSLTSWKGPESLDKRILTPAGRFVIEGFQAGITDRTPALENQLRGLTGDLPTMTGPQAAPTGGGGATAPAATPLVAAGGTPPARIVIDVTGADEDLVRLLRRIVRVRGRGNVQTALGNGNG